jgi:hypothetical protein
MDLNNLAKVFSEILTSIDQTSTAFLERAVLGKI